jgi:hypothetical protein
VIGWRVEENSPRGMKGITCEVMSNKFSEERRDLVRVAVRGGKWHLANVVCGCGSVWSVKRGTPRGWGEVRGIMRGAGFW